MNQVANDTGPASDADKREQLRAKIETAEQRNAERTFADTAREAADTATDFVKRHPVATIAGAVVAGLAIGAMTKPGRRLTKRGGVLAAIAAEAAMAYGMKALDGAGDLAKTAGSTLGDLSEDVGSQARSLGRDALSRADGAGDILRDSARKLANTSARTIQDARKRISR
ncbi:hypothetical protein [Qipengyuania marisflavi]|uniref:DUF883 family protein n=1 Tax=Qipengyuania marisflavi TaxID=2486356 RepID=A0A5S3P8L2_9SPHN|nr:hypothetical protein [Qipengyuania marisflavi]TMM49834.1 hypothetical protein FEV51_01130 [Qipengyuania marisflavi]